MSNELTRRRSLAVLAAAPALAARSATPTQAAPFVRTRSALERLRDLGASVRDTGAVGDGIADDTAAIQEVARYFGEHGGEWRIPAGTYRTTAPIEIDCRTAQTITGNGSRAVYPGRFSADVATGATTILPVHSGREAFRFVGRSQGEGSIEFRYVALATLERDPAPVAAFGWDAGPYFLRDFCFIGCSIHGFTSAFDVYRTAPPGNQVGLFRAHHCRINRNRWIARTLDGCQWNGFDFSFNEAGQNGVEEGTGGIAISGHGVSLVGNCLEGMRDPIRITGGFQGVDIRSNYFESNVGRALIWLDSVEGPFDIGPNSVLDVGRDKLDHIVLLKACGSGRSMLPYRPDGIHRMDSPPPHDRSEGMAGPGSDRDGFLRCDSPDAAGLLRVPNWLGSNRPALATRSTGPHPVTGQPVELGRMETGRDARVTFDSSLNGRPGDWLVASMMLKREHGSGAPADPYVSMNVNGNGARGSRDYVVYRYASWWRSGEWSILTAAIRLGAAMERAVVDLYPFGVRPSAAGIATLGRPTIYTVGALTDVKPYAPA